MIDKNIAHYSSTNKANPVPVDGRGRVVLIGFGEALSAPEVAWNLLDAGFRVAAIIRRGCRAPIRRIRNVELIEVTPPEVQAYESVEQLCYAVKHVGAAVVLPLDDASVWLCEAGSQEIVAPVAGSSGTHARLALDKNLQLEAAKDAGFNVPSTQYIRYTHELSQVDCFPVILKPALAIAEVNRRLRKGPMHYCADRKELNAFAQYWEENTPILVQPVLSGTGEGLFGLAGQGGVQCWSAHRRIRMMNPAGSGSSACRSLPITDQPVDAAERMLKKVNWQGLFMIELLRDQSGKVWFMEMNGRSWGSMALALRQGYDYPAWTVRQTLDPSFNLPQEVLGQPISCRHLGREIVHVLMVLGAKSSASFMRGRSKWRTILEVCRLSRCDRWYNWRPGNTLLFLEDAADTVLGPIARRLRAPE